jgi:hypothetical protein
MTYDDVPAGFKVYDDVPEGYTVIPSRKPAEAPAGETAERMAVPERPRRGDELTAPDPSPSGPITAPTPKPLVDVTGSTARVQNEIRKGAPGEDLADAEARAKGVEDQTNPIKDDWIAKEIVTGLPVGGAVGKVVGAAAPVVRRAMGAIADTAAGREAGRALTSIAEGAGKKLREALGEVRPEAEAMLKEKPWLAKGKTTADVAKNFAEEGKTLAAEREKLLELADSHAAAEGAAPGVPLSTVAENVNARIAKLSKGTTGQREVAAQMEARRETLLAAHQETGAIPSKALREQMSEYQTAYDKTASAAATKADREMSKALGDSLKAHVDDPALMSRIDALTDQMSVTTRASKALGAKVRTEAAPGGPPTTGIVKKIAHDVAHSHGTPNAIAKVGKRILSPAASAADRAVGAVARRMDPAIASVVERGVAEHWGAVRLAREIANVQPAMAAEADQ